jgi:F-box/WD-40 domain protein 7
MTIKDELLFAGTGDGRIMAWNFPAKESNLRPVAILSGHERQVISLSVSETRLYSASVDKTIRVRIMFQTCLFLLITRYYVCI